MMAYSVEGLAKGNTRCFSGNDNFTISTSVDDFDYEESGYFYTLNFKVESINW